MNNTLIIKQQALISVLTLILMLPFLFLKASKPEANNESIPQNKEINEAAPAKTQKVTKPISTQRSNSSEKKINFRFNESISTILKKNWKKPFNYRHGDYCKIEVDPSNLKIISIFCNTGVILERSVQKSYEKSLNNIEKSFFNGNYMIVFPDKGHNA